MMNPIRTLIPLLIVSSLILLVQGTHLHEPTLNELLLSKARPTSDTKLERRGNESSGRRRKLSDDDGSNKDDDYFNSNDIAFDGYSLKYATCQKVQRFSSNAVKRGEYSSMVTDDIVILRLCPNQSCSESSRYGCSSGYGEYAIDVTDYMTIMMKYHADKQSSFCNFCDSCDFQNDDGGYNAYSSNTCQNYADECQETCFSDDDAYYGDSNYMKYAQYLSCEKVQDAQYYNSYFYAKPHCDPSTNKIQMGLFYDGHCTQSAGDDFDLSTYIGGFFEEDAFEYAQDISCVDCSSSVSSLDMWGYFLFFNLNLNLTVSIFFSNERNCDRYTPLSTIQTIIFVTTFTRRAENVTLISVAILEYIMMMMIVVVVVALALNQHNISVHSWKAFAMEHMMSMERYI